MNLKHLFKNSLFLRERVRCIEDFVRGANMYLMKVQKEKKKEGEKEYLKR